MPEPAFDSTHVRVIREVSGDPEAGVYSDDALLSTAGTSGVPHIRLWYNRPCIVLGRGYAKKLPKPVTHIANLPVLVRSSGGEVVLHGPGVLNISVAVPTSLWSGSIEQVFAGLSAGVAQALGTCGWETSVGVVPGSYCPGDHDVAVSGRKVMGISQRRTREAVLVHGSLNVSITPEIYAYALGRFYSAAGIDDTADPNLIGSLYDGPIDEEKKTSLEEAIVTSLLHVWSQQTGVTWVRE